MKATAKKTATSNKREIMKTGGGIAKLVSDDNPFNFIDEQLVGLQNDYDDDAPSTSGVGAIPIIAETAGEFEADEPVQEFVLPEKAAGVSIMMTPHTGSKFVKNIMKPSNSAKKTPISGKRGGGTQNDEELMQLRKKKVKLEVENLKETLKKTKLEVLKLRRELDLPDDDPTTIEIIDM